MKKIVYPIALLCTALLFCGAGVSIVFPGIDYPLTGLESGEKNAGVYLKNTPAIKGQTVKTYTADLSEGLIGVSRLYPVDDPYDNVFHFQLDEAPAAGDRVWLAYELTGVQDHSAVARSINTHQSVGGYFVCANNRWSLQREQLDGAWLHKGDNVVRFSLPLAAAYSYRIRSIELVVEKAVAADPAAGKRALVINQPSAVYFGEKAYLKGFLAGAGAESARVFIGQQALEVVQGEFEYIATKPAGAAAGWTLDLRAVYPDGRELHKKVPFTQSRKADWEWMPAAKGTSCAQLFEKGACGSLNAFGAGLEVPAGALMENKTISVTALREVDMPALDPDLVNVTPNGGGYRFLPDGLLFHHDVEIRLEYDPNRIPEGYTAADIRTYYFDEADRRWKMLLRDTLHPDYTQVVSKTNHFTDYINGIIKVPESSPTQGYKPTEIKDLKAADPSAGIALIDPPAANNMGAASVQLPLKLPAGRQGMQPQLAIQYNSEGGNGWLGLGWDLSVPAITPDTRWGVPRYDPNLETETYLMGGDQLIPLAHRAVPVARSVNKRFYPRVEGAFQQIIRHGDHPENYWWEVVSKDGGRSFYGGDDNSVLKDDSGNIAQWCLREVRDVNGNFMRYKYSTVSDPGVNGGTVPGRQIYLQSIVYTGFGNTEGKYSVLFTRSSDMPGQPARPDAVINGRLGFKQVTADLLRKITVQFDGNPVREYELLYKVGAFSKMLLDLVIEYDAEKEAFSRHAFDYWDDIRDDNDFYQPYKASQPWEVPHDGIEGDLINPIPTFEDEISMLGGSTSSNFGVSGALSFGIGPSNDKLLTVGGHYGFSKAKNDGKVALIDLTGDGLPDKVFRQGDNLYYERNLSRSQTKFAAKRQVLNIDEFSHSETTTHSYGFDAEFLLHLGWDKSKSKTFTSVYFGDFNGDRLMDLVRNGSVWFNHLNADGDPEFSLKSSDTPCPIIAGAAIDPTVLAFDPSEQAALEEENPLHDVVRLWKPPYKGSITINAPVQLLNDQSPDALAYLQKDGVHVTIEHSAKGQLWEKPIKNNDLYIPTGDGLNGNSIDVDTSDHIYFRVQSVYDGAYDQVLWNPEIVYTAIALPNVPAERDPNNKRIHRYKASEDFVLGLGQAVGMEYAGKIHFEGKLIKPVTSDSITVEVLKTDKQMTDTVLLFQQGFNWSDTAQPFTFSLDSSVTFGDQVAARIRSATNIDWSAVSLDVNLHYTAATDTSGATVQVFDQGKPLLHFTPSVQYTMYNYLIKKGGFFQSSDPGTLVVKPSFNVPVWVQSGWDKAEMGYDLTLSVKGINKLYDIKTIHLFADSIPPSVDPELRVKIPEDEPVWVEYHIQSRGKADTIARDWLHVDARFNGANISLEPGIFTVLSESEFIFGSMYRGWGQFAYKGNGAQGQAKINKSLLKLSDILKNPPNEQDMQSVDHPGKIPNTYEPAKDPFIMMFPDAKRKRWLGYDESTWVNADSVSSSRMGDDDVRLVFIPPQGSSELQSPRLASVSTSETISGGVNVGIGGFGGGISGSESVTFSTTKVSVMDISGDNFPDIVGPDYVQITDPLGGRSANTIQHGLGNHSSKSYAVGAAASGGYSAAIGKNTDTPGKGSPRISIGGIAVVNSSSVASQGAAQSASASVNISGNYNTTSDTTGHTWLDINGDGLADKVYRDGWVQLNLGYRFAEKENWGFSEIRTGTSTDWGAGAGGGFGGAYNYGSFSFSGGISVNKSESQTQIALQDINGDGLTDIIETGNPMSVRFNTGKGFSNSVDWGDNKHLDRNKSVGEGANASFTVCVFIYVPFLVLKICLTPGGSIGHSVSSEELQIADINGDGFPDLLESGSDGELSVKSSTIGRTNLLKTVHRPMHSSFALNYQLTGNTYDLPQSKWVLAGVDLFDGLPGDGADHMKTTFEYEGGRYHRRERDFYGFQTVTTRQLDTKNNDAVYRTITQTFKNDNYYEKGLLVREALHDKDGNPYTETINTYELRDPANQGPFNPLSETGRGYPALTETRKLFYEGQPTPGLQNRTTFVYDILGNVIQFTDFGDGTAGDILTATITYHDIDPLYIKALPKTIEVKGPDGSRLRYREADVDNTGNVTQIRQFLASGNPATFDMAYDPYGNLTKITRPENAQGKRLHFEYTYDNVVHTYATQVKDTYGYTSATTYDYAFGLPLESVDVNNERIRYSLDAKGRIDTITGPYELAAGKPYTILFEYHPDAGVPYATTKHYDPANNADIETVTFMDGLQRPVQVKKTGSLFTGKNAADSPVMIVSGRINFDAFGRAVENYYPLTEPENNKFQFNKDYDAIAPTVTGYDVLDRKVLVTLPDNSKTAMEYAIAPDNSGYTCFKTAVTDALNNVKENYTDLRGRTRAVKENGPIWTDFRYNLLGELLQTTDNGSNVTEYTYDLLGRRLSVKHPDAGLTEFTYDLVGNVTRKVTPNIRAIHPDSAIEYTYDYERLIQIDYPVNYQNIVRYHYGEPGAKHHRAGRIWLQEDASGGQEFFYGPLGEVVKNIRTMLVSNIRMITYVSESRYDTWNRIDTMIYPDGEIVKYRYNRAGKLSGMNGFKLDQNYAYVDRLGYDKFEQRAFLRLGNGTETNYAYEPERRRLSKMDVTDTNGRTFMNNIYTYDAVGNIEALNNQAPVQGIEIGGPATHKYTYDNLYRLVAAEGVWTGPIRQERYSLKMEYDDLHNITRKAQQHLNNGSVINATTYDQAYTYDTDRPHVPVQIGDKTYQYDANGNLNSWARDAFLQNRYIHWDEENRIQDIWEDGYLSQYTYDAAGERAIKSHGGLQVAYTNGAPAGAINHRDNFTAYVSPYLVARDLQFTKHYYIEGQRILSKIGTGKFFYPLTPVPGQYVTAGDLDYQKRMELLARADSMNKIAPASPTNPVLPASGLQPNLPDPSTFNHLAWDLPKTTNDNVQPGFNLRDIIYNVESNTYYFHPDHLGSTSYITDFNGKLRQHVEYMPFGETFVEEHLNTDPLQPYLYNAKELDAETGLYYYGARYYDPQTSMWASVDPMAEKYPGWSPYNYTLLNPVRYVDPDGRQTVDLDGSSGFQGSPLLLSEKVKLQMVANRRSNEMPENWEKQPFPEGLSEFNLVKNNKALLFANSKTGDKVIAFAGTRDMADWGENKDAQLGGSFDNFEAALIADVINTIFPNDKLTLLGHSKGGGNAAYASMATGLDATTFNAETVSDESVRSIHGVKKSNITNWQIDGQILDIVHPYSQGNRYTIIPNSPGLRNASSIEKHGIDFFQRVLNDPGGFRLK